jgi:ATP-dependent DNA helicase RecG
MDIQKILFLLTKDENPKLDFKLKLSSETESSKKELAKDISAIANSKGGRGFIIFGIEDKTKAIIGINKSEFNEEKIQQIVCSRIDPPVPVSVDLVNINGKDIGVITIYTTAQKPHQLRDNGAFYIRRGSTTDIMRKDEIASTLEETGIVNHELLPVLKASIENLDRVKINDYFLKAGVSGYVGNVFLIETGILINEKDFEKPHPSFGGMLLFGKNPETFLPHCIIRVHNSINQKLPYHFISRGTIMEMLEETCEFCEKCLTGYEFLMETIEEHLGKSILYRDYFDINNCIEIYLTKKYIEITNPGAAIKGEENDKEKYVKRNMWLYLKAITIDNEHKYFNKDYNMNLPLISKVKVKYLNLVSKNIFKVIIPIRPEEKS